MGRNSMVSIIPLVRTGDKEKRSRKRGSLQTCSFFKLMALHGAVAPSRSP